MARAATLVVVAAFGLAAAGYPTSPAAADPAPAPFEGAKLLTVVGQSCYGGGTRVAVEFRWLPALSAHGTQQWLDLSLSPSFTPGTYVSAGPLSRQARSYSWPGLQPGRVHYWRINTRVDTGWIPSNVARFTSSVCPVTAPSQLRVTSSCSPVRPGTNRVTFEWEPAPGNRGQWLDLSLASGFSPGTFVGAGPLGPGRGRLVWDGIRSSALHYWRVNAFVDGRWQNAQASFFSSACR